MFCSNCGKEIDNDARYCKYCGKEIETIDEMSMQPKDKKPDSTNNNLDNADKTAQKDNSTNDFRPKNNSHRFIMTIIIIAVVLAIGLVLYYFKINNDYMNAVDSDNLVLVNKEPIEIINIINDAEANKDRYLKRFAILQTQKDKYYVKYYNYIAKCNTSLCNNLYNFYDGDYEAAKITIIKETNDKYPTTLPQCHSLSYKDQGGTEGIEINIDRLLKNDAQHLSQAVIDYLKMEMSRNEDTYTDGPDWEKHILTQEIEHYTKFLNKYPKFVLKDEMMKKIAKSKSLLSSCMDKTKGDYYFIRLEDAVNDFNSTSRKTTLKYSDFAFYTLQKKYEYYIDLMNNYNADGIWDLYSVDEAETDTSGNGNRVCKINVKKYYNYGIKFKSTEGSTLFVVDYKFLLDNYGKNLSNTYKTWLNYKINQIEFRDGHPISTKTEFKNEIKYLENFIDKNQDFICIRDAIKRLEFMQEFYISFPLWN